VSEMAEYQVTKYETDKSIVIIRKPILTDEERKAREEKIKKALVRFEKERIKNNGYKN
jgi:hypothetical protein